MARCASPNLVSQRFAGDRLATAAVTGAVTAAIAFAIVWAITLFSGTSFIDAIRQPTFWLVEGAAMAIAVVITLSKSGGDTTTTTHSPMRRVASHVGWAAVAAIAIGALLAVASDVSVGRLLTSPGFLIPAGLALVVVALEVWPTNRRNLD